MLFKHTFPNSFPGKGYLFLYNCLKQSGQVSSDKHGNQGPGSQATSTPSPTSWVCSPELLYALFYYMYVCCTLHSVLSQHSCFYQKKLLKGDAKNPNGVCWPGPSCPPTKCWLFALCRSCSHVRPQKLHHDYVLSHQQPETKYNFNPSTPDFKKYILPTFLKRNVWVR